MAPLTVPNLRRPSDQPAGPSTRLARRLVRNLSCETLKKVRGKKVVGGGAQPVSSPGYFASGYPVGDNAFHAVGDSPSGPFFSVRAFAICATVAG